jgi:kinesin family protein C1
MEFVQSALNGYHVCLFSYGQTGSGKTHTMQGSDNSRMRGIIPHAVEKNLTHVKGLQSQKWKYSISVNFLKFTMKNYVTCWFQWLLIMG